MLDDDRVRTVCVAAWKWLLRLPADPDPWNFVVMPNHVHGVAWLPERGVRARRVRPAPFQRSGFSETSSKNWAVEEMAAPLQRVGPKTGALADFVRSFKSLTARRVNLLRRTTGAPVWQRNYYERVIRNEEELSRIRDYILDNPKKWTEDPENPLAVPTSARR